MAAEVTIICLVRHGHATARVCLESLYASTSAPVRVIYVDIGSPAEVRRYLAERAATREGFSHLRFDGFISRQTARIKALEGVTTPLVVFLDNNMLCPSGWLEKLLATRAQTDAAIVSPIIVTHGGRVHFSGAVIARKRWRFIGPKRTYRAQEQPAAPVGTMLADCRPRRIEIDFAESHCCLAATEDLRLPGVLDERMHNAHTTCAAAYRLKTSFGRKIVVEPTSVVAIAPIGFGYDLPWMCRSYLRPDLLREAYRRLEALMGTGPGTDARNAFRWHAKHLKYLLLTMLEDNRFEREDFLAPEEVPASLKGYDLPLPGDADNVIRTEILPRVERRYPDLVDSLAQWLGRDLPL